jgi:Glyoxalase/Bleomycin resistance protein/Dioxygenase superfamily
MSKASDAPYDGLYQVAYVTNDFERALKQFGDTHRIAQFMELPRMAYITGPGREAVCNIALAYVGAIEIEVIEPLEGDVQLYRDYLPKDGAFAVRHHHLSRLFDSREALERQIAAYRAQGRAVPIDGSSAGGGARYFYADYRAELGHYMEGIHYEPDARVFLASIPRY